MSIEAGSRKSLAYAIGAAAAIHAAALGSYFAFNSRTPLVEEPKPVPQLPVCGPIDNGAAGKALRKAAIPDLNGRKADTFAMAFDYSIKKGVASVSGIYLISRYQIAPESVNLEGIPFVSDCIGAVQESLRHAAKPLRHGPDQECPVEAGNLIGRRFQLQLLQNKVNLHGQGSRSELSSLDMEYRVQGGKGTALLVNLTEYRKTANDAVHLGSPDFASVPDCSGTVVFRLPVE